MKNFIFVAGLALVMTACGSNASSNEAAPAEEIVATDVVPAAATDVLPVAVPSAENGGKVATEVIPNEPAK